MAEDASPTSDSDGRRHRKRRRNPPGKGRKPRQKARRERSAGVIVFRDVLDEQQVPRRFYLLLDYGRHWDYPKGHLEKGEDDMTAARRELAEETGIDDIALAEGFSREIVYHFHSSRKGLVRKEVIFFAGRVDHDVVTLSHEHVGYAWLEREPALAQLTFDNARNVLSAAADFLDEHDPLRNEA